jgi:hypothetical protein
VNIVMVKKKNGKRRMCTYFTGLNKCCPKDDFPLSIIDKVVDLAIGYETMALIDCFSSYHQIWLCKENEEKTSFITPFGIYDYLRMPEGLKNARPMFCIMMKVILRYQILRNVFTYIDDIVVASKKKNNKIDDLAQLKLNPEICLFCAWGKSARITSICKGDRSQP